MSKHSGQLALVVSMAMLTSGCATAGGSTSQLENAVYQTHRMVQDLDRNLSSSVTQLNDVASELVARLNTSENETLKLMSIAEENQYKLENLQRSLDQLTATLYRHLNLSPPITLSVPPTPTQPFGTPNQTGAPVEIQQPDSTSPSITSPEITAPSPDSFTSPPPPTQQTSDEQYREAQELYGTEQYDLAARMFEEQIRLFPNSPHVSNATYWRAHCYFKMGEYEKAIQGFDQLRTQYPDSGKVPIAMHNQAVAYSRLGQNERAKALFQRLIREHPDDVATESARDKLRQLQGL